MMKKRNYVAAALAAVMGLSTLSGCSSAASTGEETQADDGKLNVIATIFPQYDFVRQIAGDDVNLSMLLPTGVEVHSYEPSTQDIVNIQNADLFIYVGGENDVWVDTIMESIEEDKRPELVRLVDLVDTVEEEIVEGMQEEEHGHSHGNDGYFEDDEVADRTLSDWYGEWQSGYPYLLDGTLDEALEHKAEESEDMSFDDYKAYYDTGYKTDVDEIAIEGDSFTFTSGEDTYSGAYEYRGYEILTYESGKRGVRYQFEKVSGDELAPTYIQFSDHEISPTDVEHFHIYTGDESFEALLTELENWPTYYPADMSGVEIAEEFGGHDHEEEVDEHVWTSPKNAITITQRLTDILSQMDAAHAEAYAENSAAYVQQLEVLDASFTDVVSNAARKTIVFGDRFPFRYLADAYGLDYYAAFPGCSTDSEASAQTVAFLIDKVEEEQIPVVFQIEMSNGKIANTIAEPTGAKVLLMHSCHNVSKDEFESGITYLELMQQNAAYLKEALG